MIKKFFLLIAACFSSLFTQRTTPSQSAPDSAQVIIIIHGTWAHKKVYQHWYSPEGYFFDAIERNVPKNTKVISFLWSGSNSSFARDAAGKALAKLIDSYPSSTKISIIAHSHGATVGVIASHYLAKNTSHRHKITHFYSLGRPVDNLLHMPNMEVIEHFYNFFSYNDAIQRVFGLYEREIVPRHERIVNMRIMIDGKDPDHSELHDPCVAEWLCELHTFLAEHAAFSFINPGLLHFFSDGPPEYSVDTERNTLRVKDQKSNTKFNHAIKTGSYKLKRSFKEFFAAKMHNMYPEEEQS